MGLRLETLTSSHTGSVRSSTSKRSSHKDDSTHKQYQTADARSAHNSTSRAGSYGSGYGGHGGGFSNYDLVGMGSWADDRSGGSSRYALSILDEPPRKKHRK